MNIKKLERFLGVNMLGLGPRLMKKEFTGQQSHKGWERVAYSWMCRKTQTRLLAWGNYNMLQDFISPV